MATRSCDQVLELVTTPAGKVVDVVYCPNSGNPFCLQHAVTASTGADYTDPLDNVDGAMLADEADAAGQDYWDLYERLTGQPRPRP